MTVVRSACFIEAQLTAHPASTGNTVPVTIRDSSLIKKHRRIRDVLRLKKSS